MPETTGVKRAEEPTTLTTLNPEKLFERMNDVISAISHRAFEIFESNGRIFGRDLDDWLRAESEILHSIHLNIAESGESLDVTAEVPGFSEKDLEISIEPYRLTIAGKREAKKEEKKGKTVYSEKCSDEILRVVDLPVAVEVDKTTATLKNGVLGLTMPKAAKARAVRIHPKAA